MDDDYDDGDVDNDDNDDNYADGDDDDDNDKQPEQNQCNTSHHQIITTAIRLQGGFPELDMITPMQQFSS